MNRVAFLTIGCVALGYALNLAVMCAGAAINEWTNQTMLNAIHTHWMWEQEQIRNEMFAPDLVDLSKPQGRY